MSEEAVNAVALAAVQEKTYAECELADVKPLGRMVFVRTHPPQQMTQSGLLFKPASATSFFSGPMHKRMVTATVLATGPKVKLGVRPGQNVTFVRMHFAYYKKLSDGTLFGWIDETQISGILDGDTRIEIVDDTPAPRTR